MFRNRELRRFAALMVVMAVVSATCGFAIDAAAGVLCLISAAAFCGAFVVFTRVRYKAIADLSSQIDIVLHNEERFLIDESDEGELSILQSEITKMMLRIREQNDALKRDKINLAESLADIAHQLRTPLTSAGLILSFLEGDLDENQRRTFVREAEELLLKMDWLITSLLKLSRLDAGVVVFQCRLTKVGEVLNAALSPLLIPMELHGIVLQRDVMEDISIVCDPGWLSEAFQNIVKNCMESFSEGGRIEIVCADNLLYTEITFRDNGKGFEAEDLPHLFDRFYRGKSTNTAGYGIGLALCRMIITRQGGTIAAKNHPLGGAVFTVRFPK